MYEVFITGSIDIFLVVTLLEVFKALIVQENVGLNTTANMTTLILNWICILFLSRF